MPLSPKREPKVVLDANVWVSALHWGGKPAAVIKTAEEGKIDIVVSEGIVGEISRFCVALYLLLLAHIPIVYYL